MNFLNRSVETIALAGICGFALGTGVALDAGGMDQRVGLWLMGIGFAAAIVGVVLMATKRK